MTVVEEKYYTNGDYLSADLHHDLFKAYQRVLDECYNNPAYCSIERCHILICLYEVLMYEAAKSEHYTEAYYYCDAYKQEIQKEREFLENNVGLLWPNNSKLAIARETALIMSADRRLESIIKESANVNLSEREKNNYEIFKKILETLQSLEDYKVARSWIKQIRAKINEEIEKEKRRIPVLTEYNKLLEELDIQYMTLDFEKMSRRKINKKGPVNQEGESRK